MPGKGAGWNQYGWRLWFDLKHGFLPKRIDRYRESRSVLFDRADVLEFYQLTSGTWVPTSVRISFYVMDKNAPLFGKVAIVADLKVDVANSHWNGALTDDTFSLSLPAGTKVIDKLRNIEYVTGAADPGKHIDELVKGAKEMAPIHSVVEVRQSTAWTWNLPLLVGLNVAVVALVIAILLAKRRHRSDAHE